MEMENYLEKRLCGSDQIPDYKMLFPIPFTQRFPSLFIVLT